MQGSKVKWKKKKGNSSLQILKLSTGKVSFFLDSQRNSFGNLNK